MKYIYGPVSSRRLGLSLGLSLTPYKVCSFDCLYCQLGRTTQVTLEKKDYIPIEEIIEELKSWFLHNPQQAQELKFITFSGSGEPTLNINIGKLIQEIKKIAPVPVAVITNASLLSEGAVRQAILEADLIVPSLDAVTMPVFLKIDRPAPGVEIEAIINGLIELRKEFKKEIWLEIMLVSGVNDDIRQVRKFVEVIEKIRPDRIQLNSPVRTTSEPDIFPVDRKKLERIKELLGEKCEIV
ncbi:MAG: radical SAM protein [Candidatus Omnitrophica bacterium]|nr:radical SAM protein [Candidatus Omnitrophota bacterium]